MVTCLRLTSLVMVLAYGSGWFSVSTAVEIVNVQTKFKTPAVETSSGNMVAVNSVISDQLRTFIPQTMFDRAKS